MLLSISNLIKVVSNLVKPLFFLFLCLWVASLSLKSLAANDIPVNKYSEQTHVVDVTFEYFEDVDSSWTILELLGSGSSSIDSLANRSLSWTKVTSGGVNFGFSHSSFWLRLKVQNDSPVSVNSVITAAYPLLDYVDFFLVRNGRVVNENRMGDLRPFTVRDVAHPDFAFRIQQAPGDSDLVYIKVKSQGSIVFPLRLMQEKQFYEQSAKSSSFYLFYFGGMFIVVLLNFSIFCMLRERVYLFYALANVGYILFFASVRGFSAQFMFPESPWLTSQIMLSAMPLLAFSSVIFARDFLNTQDGFPKLDFCLKLVAAAEVANFVCSFLLSYDLSVRLSALLGVPFFAVLLLAGPITWWYGRKTGAFFTLAWSMLTIGSILTLLRLMGLVPDSFLTHYAMQLGSGAEAIILMIALAYRIYHEREAKIEAQRQSIIETQEKRDTQDRLVKAMLHDPVTQLPNRSLFEMSINDHISRSPNTDYMVVLVKVGRFSEISKILGLSTGEVY